MNSAWTVPIYNTVALIAVFLTIYVMQKTEHDRINKVAPSWLQWVRRFGFILMALALCNSILSDASQFSLILVIGSGIYSLAINALALSLRVPPNNQSGRPIAIGASFMKWETIRHAVSSFRHVFHK
jgi:hypothetical protein